MPVKPINFFKKKKKPYKYSGSWQSKFGPKKFRVASYFSTKLQISCLPPYPSTNTFPYIYHSRKLLDVKTGPVVSWVITEYRSESGGMLFPRNTDSQLTECKNAILFFFARVLNIFEYFHNAQGIHKGEIL